MTVPRRSTILLLAFPLILLWTLPITAHRVMKGGCLNYGHSCLGAHGKRASMPALPRPLLDIIMDALNTPEHINNMYPYAVINSLSDQRSGVPARRFLSPAGNQLGDEGVDLRLGGVVGDDDLEGVATRVKGDSLGSTGSQDQDAMLYYGSIDDDYSDARYKRQVFSYKSPVVATSAASRVFHSTDSQDWKRIHLQKEQKQQEEQQQQENQHEEQQGTREYVPQRTLASQANWWRR
ncbi:uncharacterized protein [Procambarus clarkii]|uniref:uncharacterized protein isoform X2 n=1 Tax=Procambarus clarkii TaxID=6728 RepID=UPI001E672113|nr:uncharacterized protein LOC123762637 isoform X2 [Procambarus clarkii]